METILVILIVGLAATYLGWRGLAIVRGGKPGCASGCGGCSSAGKPNVVPLELGPKLGNGK